MMPPYQQRGQPVSPAAFNQLVDLARSSQIINVVGGTFQRSIGGTTINVYPEQALTGSGGGSIPCPFQCSDASTATDLKVQVAWGLIWQMLPTGMFPNNDPPLKLTVTQTCFIYSKITFDPDTLIPSAVAFTVENALKSNTSTEQYNLIAAVTVSEGEDPKITGIRNICAQPFPSPCALAPQV